MSSGFRGLTVLRAGAAAFLSMTLVMTSLPAGAGVTSSTDTRSYDVSGTSASSLVSYMRNNPFPGDKGAAVANIRPSYSLSIATKQVGGLCQASGINLSVHFVMTLPHAVNASSLNGGTRVAWDSFVGFARQHEETHRAIYMQCANEFAAKALRLTSQRCFALDSRIRGMLEAEKRACDSRQAAFDRAQYRLVFGLSLFNMAKYAGRKVTPVSVRTVTPIISTPASH